MFSVAKKSCKVHTVDSQEVACPEHLSCIPSSQGTTKSVYIRQVLRGLAYTILVCPTHQECHRADTPIEVQSPFLIILGSRNQGFDLRSVVFQTLGGQTVKTKIQLEIVIFRCELDCNLLRHRCRTISASRLNKILQYRMICLIKCLDQVGMLFLSELSRQRCTKYTSQQGFDVPDSPNGHGEEKGFSQTTNTDGDRSRSHCFQSTRFRQDLSHLLSECAEYRTSLSARIARRHISWLEQTRISHCSECAEKASTTQYVK